MFHTKLRGAAQAPAALVSESIVGGLADAIGLSALSLSDHSGSMIPSKHG